jgi:hypothetical protein
VPRIVLPFSLEQGSAYTVASDSGKPVIDRASPAFREDLDMRSMIRIMRLPKAALPALALFGACCAGVPARAQNFAFVPAPQQDLNRLYRVDQANGEVIACQFAVKDDAPLGLTLCYPAGEGAKAGEPGDYGLVASSHRQEGGIFRVNRRNGAISVCYVREDQEVVCTPPSK